MNASRIHKLLVLLCVASCFISCDDSGVSGTDGRSSAVEASSSAAVSSASATNTPYWNPQVAYGTLTDARDGKSYRTIAVGDREWMAENLAYVVQRDSVECIGRNAASCARYGRLYTWAVALDLCPASWHVPSQEEFAALVAAAGENPAYSLMATVEWYGQDQASDALGFAALPSGYFDSRGYSVGLSYEAFWWIRGDSAELGGAWRFVYGGYQEGVLVNKNRKSSLRCVRALQN